MTILIVNYEFPPIGGGGGNASYFWARELARSGHSVTVLTSRFRGLPKEEIMSDFRVIRISAVRRRAETSNIFEMMTFVISGLSQIGKIADRIRPDRIISFFTIPSSPLAYFLRVTRGTPYDTLLRGGDVPGFQGVGRAAECAHVILKPLIRRLWRNSDRVIANSKGLAELAEKTWSGRIDVLPNGIDTVWYRPSEDSARSAGVRLLFVGRLSAQKGLAPFLAGMAMIKTNNAWSLTLVGDGPERRKLETVTNRSGLGDKINFRGWIDKRQLLEEYQQGDVLVFPSLDEGMPNAVLEAMACGLPVVATRIAGIVDLVCHGENGYLYDPHDVRAGIDFTKRLIEDERQRKRMGKESRLRAESYGWKGIVYRYQALVSMNQEKCLQ